MLIHIINSIFSGVYTSQFLKSKQNKKINIILWTLTYFVVQMVIFEVIESRYPFNDVVGAIINVLLILGMQWIFFRKGASGQLFVCFSFVAGKEIVKYIASVLISALGFFVEKWVDNLVIQDRIASLEQVEIIMSIITFACILVYGWYGQTILLRRFLMMILSE